MEELAILDVLGMLCIAPLLAFGAFVIVLGLWGLLFDDDQPEDCE